MPASNAINFIFIQEITRVQITMAALRVANQVNP